jgi:multidrug efflux system outer membrane protein
MRNAFIAALLASALAAPALHAAEAPTAAPPLAALTLDPAAPRTDWWAGLQDPLLDQVATYALRRNRDQKAAEADVRRARALAKVEGWSLLPTGSIGLGGGRQRDAQWDREGDFVAADASIAWEADVFGRLRNNARAAKLDAISIDEARRGVMTTIVAQIASTYVELRGAQVRLAATESNAAAQAATLRLTEVMRDAGRSTPLDVMRSKAQLESTQSAAPLLRAQIDGAIAALDVLAAGLPPELTAALRAQGAVPEPPQRLSVGTPQDLLRRRPDIRQAEARLQAAQARTKAARVDWWPRLSFVGQASSIGADFADLGKHVGFSFLAGPRIDWPALDFRRNALRLEAAKAGAEAEYERYENLVLGGARDLDTALANLGGALQSEARLQESVDAARRAAEISRLRYREGAESSFAVLDAERSLAGFEDSLAVAGTRSALAYIRVGQALGAGWSDSEVRPERQAEAKRDRAG